VTDLPRTLAALTTVGLGGPAPRLITVASEDELAEALGAADREDGALVVGGGSNLVVADRGIDVPVVRIAIGGLDLGVVAGDVIPGGADAGTVATIGAGVSWDDAVAELVDAGYAGLAPLSGIPGSAGATPVQNVGAYGVEIADALIDVDLYRRDTGRRLRVPAAALGLAYRRSVLKGTDRAVITRIRLRLAAGPGPVRYPDLAALLGVPVGGVAPARDIRAAVLELRRRKGMVLDPADPDTRSAGSFFTNPIVDGALLARVRTAVAARLGDDARMPEYPAAVVPVENSTPDTAALGATWPNSTAPGVPSRHIDRAGVKLSAAWLIERAGFAKGYPLADRPDAGIALSSKHTLALTNRGHGSTAELMALAREIRDGVRDAFGVVLRPEPVLVGCSLG
jgi:UDP-N-acetylmuramate dehydrogenase